MGSGSRERIVEVFDALDAELDRLDEVSFAAVPYTHLPLPDKAYVLLLGDASTDNNKRHNM
ncbi:hypothetical protein [Mycobacterium tuberculosis]|uniref:hypothetical protein n=1 Tax=Mycobacterium tuberculosis TaxID=1773 RepID=UPI00054CB9D0|nr:hypothetical protein [Mycobacterium tuberculosis]